MTLIIFLITQTSQMLIACFHLSLLSSFRSHISLQSTLVLNEQILVENLMPWLVIVNKNSNKLCGKLPQYAAPLQVDLWPFDLESGVRVTCDVAYLCANFSLPRPVCSRLRPDVCDRQTDVRCASSLNAPSPRGGGIIIILGYIVLVFSISSVAQWLGCWTCNQQVTGCTHSHHTFGQRPWTSRSHILPLSPSSIIWCQA